MKAKFGSDSLYKDSQFISKYSIWVFQMKAHVEKPLNPKFQFIWACLWKMAKEILYKILYGVLYMSEERAICTVHEKKIDKKNLMIVRN